MTETVDPAPAEPPRGKRLKRFLWVAPAALVLVALLSGWVVHRVWRSRVSDVGAAINLGPLAEKLGQGLDAMSNGFATMGTELEAASGEARRIVDDLSQDRLSDAYQATSQAFQRRMNAERFAQFVNDHPALRAGMVNIAFEFNKQTPIGKVHLTGNVMRFNSQGPMKSSGSGPDGSNKATSSTGTSKAPTSNVKLVLIDENGDLKMDQLVVGGDEAP